MHKILSFLTGETPESLMDKLWPITLERLFVAILYGIGLFISAGWGFISAYCMCNKVWHGIAGAILLAVNYCILSKEDG